MSSTRLIYFVTIRLERLLLIGSLCLLTATMLYVGVSRAQQRPKALSSWLIAVDAGHGGHDKGAWFPQHELVEKEVNLAVATELSQILNYAGAAVILIRTDDTFVGLADRAAKANTAEARIFVSLHVNRYPADTSCCGAQVFYGNSMASQQLGTLVQNELLAIDPSNHRQALPGDYKVLRDAKMPAILVEIGFATNSRDRELIMNPQYRRDVAHAIRAGIIQFADITAEEHTPLSALWAQPHTAAR